MQLFQNKNSKAEVIARVCSQFINFVSHCGGLNVQGVFIFLIFILVNDVCAAKYAAARKATRRAGIRAVTIL